MVSKRAGFTLSPQVPQSTLDSAYGTDTEPQTAVPKIHLRTPSLPSPEGTVTLYLTPGRDFLGRHGEASLSPERLSGLKRTAQRPAFQEAAVP